MENKLYRLVFLTAIIFFAVAVQAQRRNARYVEYINKYSDLAVEQMKLHKIPASITLAQGLLESGAGNSQLARKSNNHFGIKCGGSWRGRSVRHDDDARNECFRAYKHPRESYEDHSDFLKRGARYAFLFKLDIAARTEKDFIETPIPPCGACRQVILETEKRYGQPIRILLYGRECIYEVKSIGDLLPLSFDASAMEE